MATTRKSKPKSADTEAQSDPKAPLDSAALLKAATPVLKNLAADLLNLADTSISIKAALQARHTADKAQERTADNYDTWRRDFVEQVAAAWFLSCVFVRTLEDRALIDRNRLAGPGAEDSQRACFALAPSLNERDYLLTVFRDLSHLPATCDLFDFFEGSLGRDSESVGWCGVAKALEVVPDNDVISNVRCAQVRLPMSGQIRS